MSEQTPGPSRFGDLVSRHFDGELSPGEWTELRDRLKTDPAGLRQFARASLLHSQLRAVFLGDRARESLETSAPAAGPVITPLLEKQTAKRWQRFAAVAGLAAALAVVASLSLRPWIAPAVPLAVQSVDIATRWFDPNVELLLRRGDLPAGPLRLESGVAEFAFASGASAVIEGPAVFEPLSQERLSITSGRVVGRCPGKQARLTIVTPGAEVVDLGTEFGVAVGDDHNTQVSVIQGEVKLVAAEQVRRMKAGESVAITARGKAEHAGYVVEDLSKLARLIPELSNAERDGKNLLVDPGMTLAPATHGAADRPLPWMGTAGHVDLAAGRARSGNSAIRIRALGNPMWPLAGQDVKTGSIDGRIVAASVWAMQPAEDPLTGRQNAIVKITFLDSSGREFASAERRFLPAEAPKNQWVRGRIAAEAPPRTAALIFQVLLNARGQKSGAILVDDASLSITTASLTIPANAPTAGDSQ